MIPFMDEKSRVVQEIQRVANSVAPKKLGQRHFFANSSVSQSKLRYYFGTWSTALEAAGLEKNPPGRHLSDYQITPNEELLREIGELWVRLGQRPSESAMNSSGKYSVKPYRDRWGKFSAAIDEYIRKFGVPEVTHGKPNLTLAVPLQKDAPIVIPKTHKPEGGGTKAKSIFW